MLFVGLTLLPASHVSIDAAALRERVKRAVGTLGAKHELASINIEIATTRDYRWASATPDLYAAARLEFYVTAGTASEDDQRQFIEQISQLLRVSTEWPDLPLELVAHGLRDRTLADINAGSPRP